MPKVCYVKKNFRPDALAAIGQANTILNEYAEQGFDMTLRQLYYQFVQRGLIPNTERDYKRLGEIINDGRLAGLIDWQSIVDRTRHVRQNAHWDSPADIVHACAEQFQVNKWVGQPEYAEVWIEKDALIGVIENACRSYDVPYFSCRGYVSQTEAWGAGLRVYPHVKAGQEVTIIHLGDHDPSGLDMTRDLQDRFDMFVGEGEVNVQRIALTMEQIRKHRPPPNPAKESDSRCADYIAKYGESSWELDSLDPATLSALVKKHILQHLDPDKFAVQLALEKAGRARLERVATDLTREAGRKEKGAKRGKRGK